MAFVATITSDIMRGVRQAQRKQYAKPAPRQTSRSPYSRSRDRSASRGGRTQSR